MPRKIVSYEWEAKDIRAGLECRYARGETKRACRLITLNVGEEAHPEWHFALMGVAKWEVVTRFMKDEQMAGHLTATNAEPVDNA